MDRKVKEPLLMETAKPMSDVTAAVASKKSSSSVTGGAGAGVDCVKPLPRKETYATQQTHPELLQTGPSSNSGAMKKPSENETPITVLPDITLSNLGNTLKWTSLELGVQLVVSQSVLIAFRLKLDRNGDIKFKLIHKFLTLGQSDVREQHWRFLCAEIRYEQTSWQYDHGHTGPYAQ